MSFYKIIIWLCLLGSSFGLSAQVAAPKSVIVKMEMPKGEAANTVQLTADAPGLPPIPSGDQAITLLVELAEDKGLQSLHLEFENPSNQQSLLTQSIDLVTKQGLPEGYQFQRDGKVIRIHLGVLSLPPTYRCKVWVVDVDGENSPATIYQGTL